METINYWISHRSEVRCSDHMVLSADVALAKNPNAKRIVSRFDTWEPMTAEDQRDYAKHIGSSTICRGCQKVYG